VTSNFPMHLFDEPLPEWPVFGINLREFHRDRPGEAVSVVRTNGEGYAPWWTRWEQDSVPGPNATLSQPTNLSGFLMGVANAAQNWSDNLQLTLPGYRERIAHVQLNGDEGGLNLNMSANLITELSSRGQVAADYLRENFTRTADEAAAQPIAKNRTPVTWENHRWWRFRTVFAALQPFLRQVGKRTTGSDTASLRPLLDKIVTADRISYDWPGSNVEQRKEKRAGAVTAAVTLADLVAEWDEEKVDFEEKAPKPSSALRFGPRV
jgi:hypothetical protein